MNESKTVLLCPPSFFDVIYSINPWMKGEKVNRRLASTQWNNLKGQLIQWGTRIHQIRPKHNLPDLVFTANAGVVHKNNIVLSNFTFPERKGEQAVFKKWFSSHGYIVHQIPEEHSFEGHGDAVILNDKMIAVYGFRSDLRGIEAAAEILQLKLTPIKLINKNFYHFDTCFCMLREDLAMYYPGAFDENIKEILKGIELIPVSKDDAYNFACNSVVKGDDILIPANNAKTVNILESKGFNVVQINTSEFLKSGGSLQCLTLWL